MEEIKADPVAYCNRIMERMGGEEIDALPVKRI
jgi:hypothetical protein